MMGMTKKREGKKGGKRTKMGKMPSACRLMGRQGSHLSSKKGIFFTLISLVMVTIITQIFTTGSAGLGGNKATQTRIEVMDGFISSMEEAYIPLALESATYRGINRTIWYMHTQNPNVYLTNPSVELGSIVKNGTYESAGTRTISTNNTFQNFTKRIETIAAATYGMEVTIKTNEVYINQTAPWYIVARVNFSLDAKSSIANWSRQDRVAVVTIPIEGFVDPMYAVNTDGYYVKRVHKSLTPVAQWDATRLGALISSGNYTRFEGLDTPSYLERFKQFPSSSSCCGIESVVNDALLPPAMRNQQKSYVDYGYFAAVGPCPNGGQPADLYNIAHAAITPPFRLEVDHVFKYKVESQAGQITC